ncbi:MAG: hypothetical protein IT237_08985 [Bacteroidia bacterium]|nr:hypothetical protein [Bacteroidia bacterium]
MKKKFKIVLSFALLAVVLFAATPKVYIHSLLGHIHHNIPAPKDGATIQQEEQNTDCNFEKFDAPVYYTVFKFFLNFSPLKPSKEISILEQSSFLPKLHKAIAYLRGPPMS